MNRPRTALLAALAAALLVAGGCGTTEDTADDPEPASTGGPVTVTDSRGETITLDAPAQKVVALEWGEAEMLASLGVMPVGMADLAGYADWVTAAPLDDDVTDVGLRGEPSVDSIVGLEPDLVVTEVQGGGSSLAAQLEEYVPVLVTTGTDTSDNLGRMREDLEMIATAVGKEAEAADLLAELDESLATGRDRVEAAGATDAPFAMADGWQEGSSISVRMFTEGSLVSDLATELGLRNAWGGPIDDELWGLATTDVEGLTRIEDQEEVQFLYNASGDEDVFADGLAGNAIWTSFPFVEQERVHKLPEGIWTFGGPRSCQQYVDALLQVYEA